MTTHHHPFLTHSPQTEDEVACTIVHYSGGHDHLLTLTEDHRRYKRHQRVLEAHNMQDFPVYETATSILSEVEAALNRGFSAIWN